MYQRSGARLGSFWDDLYKGAGTIVGIAKTVQQGAVAGREVQSGNAQIAVLPTSQGLSTYTQQYAPRAVPYLLIGGAALAVVLLTRRK